MSKGCLDTRLFNAVKFAAEKHKLQRRKGTGESYITHPIGVADILISAGVDNVECLIAAILHDTVEDTDTSFDEIEELFGKTVRGYVMEVTDDKSLPKVARKKLQVEHVISASTEAKLIKLADKIHNLTDLLRVPPEGWTNEDVRGYFLWAREVVIHAWHLNSALKKRLEDLFDTKFSNGEYIIPRNIDDVYNGLRKYYKSME
jgi:guanosine-3',5'-bis(diphosphate) 3'-pyrophosphohydrolase